MAYRINHIHLKSPDPRRTADWYVGAFGFTITSDETRVFGDRFIRCASPDGGVNVNIGGQVGGLQENQRDAVRIFIPWNPLDPLPDDAIPESEVPYPSGKLTLGDDEVFGEPQSDLEQS